MTYRIDDLNYMATLYCPGRCLNCNIWKMGKSEATKGEISMEVLERALRSTALANAFYFDLTGGESQLAPHYVQSVRLISTLRPGSFLHTNISGWYPQVHRKVVGECMEYIDPAKFRVDVSLDGSPETYKKLRLVPDGWNKAVKTIELLRETGIIVRIAFIVHRQNYTDIEWARDFADHHGIGWYIGFSRQADLLKNKGRTDIGFNGTELDSIEASLQRIGFLDTPRRSHWLWAKSVYTNEEVLFDCHMGRRALVVDPYGGVYPCNELSPSLKMGNLMDYDGDLDLLLRSPAAAAVREKIANRQCQPCTMLCAHKAVFPWGNHTGMR